MISVALLKIIHFMRLTATAKQLKKLLMRIRIWPQAGFGYTHRNRAYKLLSGHGLEVGALHFPANVPSSCKMEYCDAHSKENLIKIFPEVVPSSLVEVTHVVNLDEEKLSLKVKGLYDFVIMNHVIEHIANPMAVFLELFNVVIPGGFIIISAPDKEFTFDKARELTTFEHLLEEFKNGVTYVEDDHYLDFIQHTAPEIYNSGDKQLLSSALKSARDRREHAHVWNSESFMAFLQESIKYLELDVRVEAISKAKNNNFECFVVLKKNAL